MMPSRFTSAESLEDAAECARLLGTRLDTIPIEPAVEAFDKMLGPVFTGRSRDITEENIQSRIRGVTLMGLSNKFGHMLLTTGSSEEHTSEIQSLMRKSYDVFRLKKKTIYKYNQSSQTV